MHLVLDNFSDLVGQTLSKVERLGDEELIFTLRNGDRYRLHHISDCYEAVTIDDLNGDLSDLVDTPILFAEESSSNENPSDVPIPEYQDSFTWTFYRIGTVKGTVVIRWYGESNGYYSESVDWSPLQ